MKVNLVYMRINIEHFVIIYVTHRFIIISFLLFSHLFYRTCIMDKCLETQIEKTQATNERES